MWYSRFSFHFWSHLPSRCNLHFSPPHLLASYPHFLQRQLEIFLLWVKENCKRKHCTRLPGWKSLVDASRQEPTTTPVEEFCQISYVSNCLTFAPPDHILLYIWSLTLQLSSPNEPWRKRYKRGSEGGTEPSSSLSSRSSQGSVPEPKVLAPIRAASSGWTLLVAVVAVLCPCLFKSGAVTMQ